MNNSICGIYTLPFFENLKFVLERLGLKRYSCLKSKKVFSQHVLFSLLVLKERLRFSYRRLIEFLGLTGLWRNLTLGRIPHYTTVQKFSERLPEGLLHDLIKELSVKKSITVVGDGTGFGTTNPSHYYESIIRKFTGKDGVIKSYMKTVIFADLESRKVIKAITSPIHTHEAVLVKELMKDLECETFIYDKALDSKEIRTELRLKGITPVIPNRKNAKKKTILNQEKYNQRNIIESIISAIKRKYGSTTTNKKTNTQNKQILIKIINHNIKNTIQNLIKTIQKLIISTELFIA